MQYELSYAPTAVQRSFVTSSSFSTPKIRGPLHKAATRVQTASHIRWFNVVQAIWRAHSLAHVEKVTPEWMHLITRFYELLDLIRLQTIGRNYYAIRITLHRSERYSSFFNLHRCALLLPSTLALTLFFHTSLVTALGPDREWVLRERYPRIRECEADFLVKYGDAAARRGA
jgi:hypothetical protein